MRRSRVFATTLLAANLVVIMSPPATAQTRSLAVAAMSGQLDQIREWDQRVDQMARSGDLQLREQIADAVVPGNVHERFIQTHDGVPIWGGDITRQSSLGSTISLFGTIYDGVALDVQPKLSPEAARDIAAGLAGGADLGAAPLPSLVILPLSDGSYALTYRCQAVTTAAAVAYFIDAADGSVRSSYNLFENQSAIVTGTGVLNDTKKVSVKTQSGTFVADDQLRPPSLQTFDLRGNLTTAINALNGVITLGTASLATDPSTTWTDGANVDAHTYEGYTYDFYFKRFGRRGLDNRDARIVGLTHTVRPQDVFTASSSVLGQFYVNAFYCPTCGSDGRGMMVYGEGLPSNVFLQVGNTRLFVKNFAGALDIVAHELTHGVTAFTSRLLGVNEPGALNEAFSDMMGTSVEFFVRQTGTGPQPNYVMGSDIFSSNQPGFARSLQDPLSFGNPDHYSRRLLDASDNGEVHANSTIASHAFYLAIEGGTNSTSRLSVQGVGSANRDQIEKTFYRGFTLLLPSNATFSIARSATIQAARDLYGTGSAVERAVTQAWTAVGVN